MKIINVVKIGILLSVLMILSNCSKTPSNSSAVSKLECIEKNGYWYNNKCWEDYKDEGIPESKIDSVVSVQMKIIKESAVTVGSQIYPLTSFIPEEDEGVVFIAIYKINNQYKTFLFPTEKGKKKFKNGKTIKTDVLLFNGDLISDDINKTAINNYIQGSGTATIKVIDFDKSELEFNGNIIEEDNAYAKSFSFKTNEVILGAGNSELEIKGDEAYLSGGLGTTTYVQVKELIKNHPEVKTIVMTNVPGSLNDAVNMHTGRLIRENGITTKVLKNSDIASGGVDLFCAGKNRVVEIGAKIGVHSWCCVNNLTASEISKEHPAHQYQLKYFTMCLGKDKGQAFYFYTLKAAPFDGIHYMTEKELQQWGVATKFVEDK